MKKEIIPCLWFNAQAYEAALFYTSIFEDSQIGKITYYGNEGFEIHGHHAGSVLTVSFQIRGNWYTALNGGPEFRFNEAISLQVFCDTQSEIDYFWTKLTEGGYEVECGWLKDKFGLSWQIVPSILEDLLDRPEKADRVMKALLQMKKIDIEALQNA